MRCARAAQPQGVLQATRSVGTHGVHPRLRVLLGLGCPGQRRLLPPLLALGVCQLLMLICILTKNVISSCSVTRMLFLHLGVNPLMTLTTVLYLSCALISGHRAMMLMELAKRR